MMWQVEVRRVSTQTVFVECAEPLVARAIAISCCSPTAGDVHSAAYEFKGTPSERWWHVDSESWVYPQQTLEGGEQ